MCPIVSAVEAYSLYSCRLQITYGLLVEERKKKNIFGDLLLWQGKPLMKYKDGGVNGVDANS